MTRPLCTNAARSSRPHSGFPTLNLPLTALISLGWCYQSNRDMDQENPQRFDLDAERTPNLVRLVVEANRQLQLQTMGFTYTKGCCPLGDSA